MSRRRAVLSVAVGGMLCIAAYVSANYILSPAVIDSGGGKAVSSSYELDCSIGGPVVATTTAGTAASTNYTLDVNTISLAEAPAAPPAGGGGDSSGGCLPSGEPALLLPLVGAGLALLRRRGQARSPTCLLKPTKNRNTSVPK